MPIYEYQCQACQKIHEALQKFSDPLLTECPECHGSLKKIMSLSGFALKGNGWYASDYKKPPVTVPSKTTDATASAGSDAAAPAAAKSDATSAAPASTPAPVAAAAPKVESAASPK